MREITEDILPPDANADEFECILGTLGAARQIGGREIEWAGGDVVVEYSASGKIVAVRASDRFNESRVLQLKAKIASALVRDEVEIHRRYLHSHYDTTGCYRWRTLFQIVPAPSSAPRPEVAFADHPFVLEYAVAKSPDLRVALHRSECCFRRTALLLNALLRGIKIPDRSTQHEWAMVPNEYGISTRYLQLGYFQGTTGHADGFSEIDELQPLESVSAVEYYNSTGVVAGQSLRVPDSLAESLGYFDELDRDSQDRFLRASYWQHVSSRVFGISASASYAALVNAVEVFLGSPESHCSKCCRPTSDMRCEECGQPTVGPSKMFRDFVDRYAPGVPNKVRRTLYDRRSGLVHGGVVLPSDLPGRRDLFNPGTTEEFEERQLLSNVVRVILVNWLHSQRPT